jgi:hypothetical protein
MLPFFKYVLTEDPETGMDMLGFVQNPAHMKDFVSFGEDQKEVKIKHLFNEEQQIVTGVMISEGTPIYRNDPDLGEHYGIFDKDSIKQIFMRFHKNQYGKNVNIDHDREQLVEQGVFMIDNYLVDEEQGVLAPKRLGQIVRDGSWIASYKVDNPETWQKIKSGEVNGFSIEAYLDRIPVEVNKKFTKIEKTAITKKIQEMKDTLKEKFNKIYKEVFGEEVENNEEDEVKMGEATTDSGEVLSWEGELEKGTLVTIMVDDAAVPAPEGSHSLTGELEGISIVLDSDGKVQEIVEADDTEAEAEADEEMNEVIEEMAKKFSKEIKSLKDKNTTLEKSNKDLKETFTKQLEDVKAEFKTELKELKEVANTPPTKTKIKQAKVRDTKNINPVAFNY